MSKTFKLSTEIFAPSNRVWETLTTSKGLANWFCATPKLEERAGGSFEFHGNFVYGWRDGIEFKSRITAFTPEKEFGFEFPLHHVNGSTTKGTAHFGLESSGRNTNLKFQYTYDTSGDLHPLAWNDIWAYYLNVITNVSEHDYHEPGLLFDFSRPWKGNIKHVIYITANPDTIFDFLWKPECLAKYFTPAKLFEPEEGGRIDFGWGQGEGPSRVIGFEPPYELVYDWPVHQDGEIHIGKVKWILEPEGRQVRLVLQQQDFGPNVDHFKTGEALGWANMLLEIKRLIESGRPALNLAATIENA